MDNTRRIDENVLAEMTGGKRNQMESGVEDANVSQTSGDVFAKENVKLFQEKYKKMDGKAYLVTTTISVDDDTEKEYVCVFRKPKTASYDRYVKTSGTSGTKALKTFVLDNICEEQSDALEEVLLDLPAMAISLGEKLLNMLGLSKDTTVKKL